MKELTSKTPPQAFPIADFSSGLFLAKEPWISPTNAFRRMENSRVFRGRLVKRNGFSRFAELTADIADRTSSGTNPGTWSGYYVFLPTSLTSRLVPESLLFTSDNGAGADITAEVKSGSQRWLDSDSTEFPSPTTSWPGDYNIDQWVWDIVATGTNDVVGALFYHPLDHFNPAGAGQRSAAYVNWSLHPDYVAPFTVTNTMDHRITEEVDVLGLKRFKTADDEYTVAWSEDHIYEYDPGANYFGIQGSGGGGTAYDPYMTGDSEDYIWSWPTDDYLLFTNGVDPLYRWEPTAAQDSAVVEMATAWGGGGNELDTCALVFIFNGRLIVVNTTEGGTKYPTRMRWTAAGAYETYNDALDYADAPSSLGDAITGQLIGDRLFIGFEEGWAEIVETNDPNSPVEWRRHISRFGAVSKNSTIEDNERLLTRAPTTMQALDPNGQYYIDEKIPDFVSDFSAEYVHLCAGARNENQRAFWWTYVDAADTSPNNILCATYDEKNELSWSIYDMPMLSFSSFDSLLTPSWNSLGPATWNELSALTWNDARVGIAGFTQLIGGSASGQVYLFDNSAVDKLIDGQADIDMLCETQWLQPFPMVRSHLAWLDIYADSDTNADITVTFYRDHRSSAFLTKTISLTPNVTGEKVWRRIKVKQSGLIHKIRIQSDDNSQISIDAIVPFFRPLGRVREFN